MDANCGHRTGQSVDKQCEKMKNNHPTCRPIAELAEGIASAREWTACTGILREDFFIALYIHFQAYAGLKKGLARDQNLLYRSSINTSEKVPKKYQPFVLDL